ncbi:rubrerythrin [Fusobacterium sp. CAG:439]|nr:rubrerythrin [Fusobacterium sp. CAG:439]
MFMCINEEGKVLELKGTETEKNLQKAFEITAKRRMEYDIYALIAEKQGFEDVAHLLTRFAKHENEHSKLWYKWVKSDSGNFPNLLDCIKAALTQEKDEIEGLYENFARKAREEGLDHIAGLLENIENIEKIHYDRLRKLILKLEDKPEPNSDGTYNWVCSTCGAVFVQKEEPEYCPLCLKEEVFFYKQPNK